MDFRTPVIIPESTFRIDHSTRIMMLGSCFTLKTSAATVGMQVQGNRKPFWNSIQSLLGCSRRKPDTFQQGVQ